MNTGIVIALAAFVLVVAAFLCGVHFGAKTIANLIAKSDLPEEIKMRIYQKLLM